MADALSNCLVFVILLSIFLLVKCSINEAEGVQEIIRFKGLVEGLVYCKSNMLRARNIRPAYATPLAGAIVSLSCSIKEDPDPMVQSIRTGENGHFSISSSKPLTRAEFHHCKVFLPSSPDQKTCNSPNELNGYGAILKFSQQLLTSDHKTTSTKDELTAGPSAFQPSKLKNQKQETGQGVSIRDVCDPSCLSCPLGCCQCLFSVDGSECSCAG